MKTAYYTQSRPDSFNLDVLFARGSAELEYCPNFSFSLRGLCDLGVSAVIWVQIHSPRRRRERKGGAENFKLGDYRARNVGSLSRLCGILFP